MTDIHILIENFNTSNCTQDLIRYIGELWKIAREKLLTVPQEEQRKLEYLTTVLTRARKSHDMILSLERQLHDAIEDKDESVS